MTKRTFQITASFHWNLLQTSAFTSISRGQLLRRDEMMSSLLTSLLRYLELCYIMIFTLNIKHLKFQGRRQCSLDVPLFVEAGRTFVFVHATVTPGYISHVMTSKCAALCKPIHTHRHLHCAPPTRQPQSNNGLTQHITTVAGESVSRQRHCHINARH